MAKGPRAYRSISEAAAEVGVEAHVLRFWERELSFIKPLKLGGGRRFYRPRDVEALAEVRRLRQAGRSLADIRRLGHGSRPSAERPPAPAPPTDEKAALAPRSWTAAWNALEAAARRLDILLAPGGGGDHHAPPSDCPGELRPL